MNRLRKIFALFVLLIIWVPSCGSFAERSNGTENTRDKEQTPSVSQPPLSAHLPFGNPSNAVTDPDNYLLIHNRHVLSYNSDRGTLNWIAWWTRATDLGERRERPRFEEDRKLPEGLRRVQYYDYSGSGYDRGHMVPAADRFANERLMEETFLMTNIVPQTGDLNQFPWNKLESYSRAIVRQGNEVYTIAGVYGEKDRLRGKVVVPTNCWKVIVVFPSRQSKDKITATTRIIAVDMPNIEGIENENWENYQTTVRSIEERTGLDLFSLVPREIQDIIETKQVRMNR